MKTIHFHIGPHKTGSSSIQNFLQANHIEILRKTGFQYVFGPEVPQAAKDLSRKNSKAGLLDILEAVSSSPASSFIISSEDFSGQLPGRSNESGVYKGIHSNLKKIQRALVGFRCIFYFFERDINAWTKSVYWQNIRSSAKFSSFNQFTSKIGSDVEWTGVLRQAKLHLGDQLVVVKYQEDATYCSIQELLKSIQGFPNHILDYSKAQRQNISPDSRIVRLFEIVNSSNASNHARMLARRKLAAFIEKGTQLPETKVRSRGSMVTVWPPENSYEDDFPDELIKLRSRVISRISSQDQPNLLPSLGFDHSLYWLNILPKNTKFPDSPRAEMPNQVEILRYRFRDRPEACLTHALAISYLRRDTPHTNHARAIFQELWRRDFALLNGTLPTRWLISALQTFLDHGVNEGQRIIGASGYFFANMLKSYEAERSLEGLEPDSVYPNVKPVVKDGGVGLDRFVLGETDLMLNTLALLLETSNRDVVAGRVLREVILRVRNGSTLFSRMDKSRLFHKISKPQFANCWSFFEEPASAGFEYENG